MLEVRTPILPEGTTATVISVHRPMNGRVEASDVLFEIETDKVVLEVVSPVDGLVIENRVKKGDQVFSEQIICVLDDDEDTYHEDLEHIQQQFKPKPASALNAEKPKADSNSGSGNKQTAIIIVSALIVLVCVIVFL